MALGALSLSVTQGVQGRPFQANIVGLTTGRVEVLGDGSPGFSTVNGKVMSTGLPYAVSTVVLREYEPGVGQGFRDSRIEITAATPAQILLTALNAVGLGRLVVSFRVAVDRQPDGTTLFILLVEDDQGATIYVSIGGVTPPPTFLSNPSISGTPTSGNPLSSLTYTDGGVANGTITSRAYLLAGAAVSLSYVLQPADVGKSIVFQNTATGPGGTTVASSAPLIVAAGSNVAVPFGAMTRTGHGGYPLGGGTAKTLTDPSGLFAIDTVVGADGTPRNHLVPKGGNYGVNTPLSAASGTYSMSASDGASTQSIVVTIVPKVMHVRSLDGGTAAAVTGFGSGDVNSSNQLKSNLESTAFAATDVTCRTRAGSYWNKPVAGADTDWRVNLNTTGTTPASAPALTEVYQDLGNGHQRLVDVTGAWRVVDCDIPYGDRWGRVIFYSANRNQYIRFNQLDFYRQKLDQTSSPASAGCAQWEQGPGFVMYYRCKAHTEPFQRPVTIGEHVWSGIVIKSTSNTAIAHDTYFIENECYDVYEGIESSGARSAIVGNYIHDNYDDSIKFLNGWDTRTTDNLALCATFLTGLHPDFLQYANTASTMNAGPYPLGVIQRNLYLYGGQPSSNDTGQGIYLDQAGGPSYTGGLISHNVMFLTAARGVGVLNASNPVVRNNIMLHDPAMGSDDFPHVILVNTTGATVSGNVSRVARAETGATGTTASNNLEPVGDAQALKPSDIFASPLYGMAAVGASPSATLALVRAAFARKAGGPLAIGAGPFDGAGAWTA